MEKRIALIGLIVNSRENTDKINSILHDYGQYILGRMGLPQIRGKISVISIVIDAPQEVISALSGKLGMLENVSAKTVYSPS